MSAAELFDLTDKVAVITGGAGGIGVVYAEALAEAGASVVLADVEPRRGAGRGGGARRARATGRSASLSTSGRRSRPIAMAAGRRRGLRRHRHPRQQRRDHGRPPAVRPVEHPGRRVGPRHRRELPWSAALHPGGAPSDGGSRRRPHRQRAVRRSVHGRRHLRGEQVRPPRPDRSTSRRSSAVVASTSTRSPPGSSTTTAATSPSRRTRRSATPSPPTIPGKPSGPPEDLVGTLLLLCSKAGDWITGQTILVDGGWISRY